MKSLIIYSSLHQGNTRTIAEKMAAELKADIYNVRDILGKSIEEYGLIGLGSGIYHGDFNEDIMRLGENLKNKNLFLFSTSGSGNENYNDCFAETLRLKKNRVIGSFSCKGYNTYGIFKYVGGKCKNHPNKADIEEAVDFVKNLDGNKPRMRYFFL